MVYNIPPQRTQANADFTAVALCVIKGHCCPVVGLCKFNKTFQGSGDLLETLGSQDDLLYLVNNLSEVCVLVSTGKYTKNS